MRGLVGAALVLALASGGAQAQTVEELQRRLDQRDAIILELLDRVEALERRTGLDPAAVAPEPPEAEPRTPSEVERADVEPRPAPPPASEAPGLVVVDEDAAERALERSLVQSGAMLLDPGRLEIEPSVSYARDEDDTPIFFATGGGTVVGQRERNVDSVTGDLSARLGLPGDAQLELGLPYRLRSAEMVNNVGFSPVEASRSTGTGLGDFRIGLAKSLLREERWRPDVVGRITWDTNTGEPSDNGVSLGGGFHELRASLSAIKRQAPIVFLGSIGYGHVFDKGGIDPGAVLSASFGGFIALSPETSLSLALSGTHRRETVMFGDVIEGSDTTAATFTVGGSTLLAPNVLMKLAVGIGLTEDADDLSIRLGLPVRFNLPLF